MAINSDVDIPLAIEKLGKKPAVLALSNSNPPHTITVWTGGDARPSDSEINTAWNSYKTDQAAVKYKSDREKEYPSWKDQLDKIYHSGVDAWKVDIKAIKDKYPKS